MSSRDLMMDAALSILAQDGIEGLTMRKIADHCGLSVAAPYKHFKNKEDLLLQSTYHLVELWKIREARIISRYAPNLEEQLVRLSMEWLSFAMEKPVYTSLITVDWSLLPSSVSSRLSSVFDYARDCLSRLSIQRRWDHETFLRTAYQIRALTDGALLQFRYHHMEDTPARRSMVEQCLRTCIPGPRNLSDSE